MKQIKKVISLALVLSLLLLLIPFNSSVIYATDDSINTEETVFHTTNKYNKLHFYFNEKEHRTIDNSKELVEATGNAKKNAEINAVINSDGTRAVEDFEITVEFKSDFMQTKEYLTFFKELEACESSEEVLSVREKINAFSKEYHDELRKNNLDSLSIFEYASLVEIGYSPFVRVKISPIKLNTEDLVALSENKNVEHISVGYEPVAVANANWTDCLNAVDAYEIYTNRDHTGKGVRIGIYEAAGVCDTANVNLSDIDITKRNSSSPIDPHATNVTSIVALMAPDAKYYVDYSPSGFDLSWFIENNCDVINCSFGLNTAKKNASGLYDKPINGYTYSHDRMCDYQIKAHLITFCVSAGNKHGDNRESSYNPDGNITSPGYAYNAITVGGVDKSSSNWIYASGASYQSGTQNAKPNISAPYTVNIPSIGTQSGTSFSTPIVTGAIAILMGCKPSYKNNPQRVLSAITSTARKTYDYDDDYDGTFNKRVGAGIIDLDSLLECHYYVSKTNTNRTADTEIYSKNVSLTSGKTIQIGLAWLVTTQENAEWTRYTNYDLKIYAPSGSSAASSTLTNSTDELIRYTATASGTHRIVIYQTGAMPSNVTSETLALTYQISAEGHVHSYEEVYESYNTTKHKQLCFCLSYMLEDHVWVNLPGNNKKRCTKCGFTAITGDSPGIM